MKIWLGFGSEHSANLVMIGRFVTPEDAAVAARELQELIDHIVSEFDYERFDENPMSVLRNPAIRDYLERLRLHIFSAEDIETLGREHHLTRRGKEIEIHTDESDLGGLVKFMIHKGARIEVYSAHDYPNPS